MMDMKKSAFVVCLLTCFSLLSGQQPNPPMQHSGHDTLAHQASMCHAYSLSLPMTRNGSGTGWQPDESPIYAYMAHRGKMMFMVHGSVTVRFNAQNFTHPGMRGYSHTVNAPNWTMGMIQRPVARNGLLVFKGMFSLDALAMGEDGYPLVFQSGETYLGQRLFDRQHPHDLFSELSVGYSHRLNSDMDIYGYVGYPGEPALGPTAFMHRISAMNIADAPLSHHWQDATHITFGVGTIGFRYKIAKLEGSLFTGREPDEARFNFDRPRFDSYSWRLSVNPHRTLAFQVSQGFLNSPESLEPGEDILRSTGSVSHTVPLRGNSFVASTFVYGLNSTRDENTHSALVESNVQMRRLAVYGRYEFVQKPADDLELSQFGEMIYDIHGFTFGANWRIATVFLTDILVGGQGKISGTHARLDRIYGNNPLAAQVYLNLRPTRLSYSPFVSTGYDRTRDTRGGRKGHDHEHNDNGRHRGHDAHEGHRH
jgi:hypothetical protein